jgi:hypothetical protein
MTTFAAAHLITWLVMTLYVVRLGARQRRLWQALDGSVTVTASHLNQQAPIRR